MDNVLSLTNVALALEASIERIEGKLGELRDRLAAVRGAIDSARAAAVPAQGKRS